MTQPARQRRVIHTTVTEDGQRADWVVHGTEADAAIAAVYLGAVMTERAIRALPHTHPNDRDVAARAVRRHIDQAMRGRLIPAIQRHQQRTTT